MKQEKIRFGLYAPPEGQDFLTIKNLCRYAERLGYDLFTITDHFMNMQNPRGHQNHPLECWTTLAALAAVTDRIALAPLVSCAHYRHPTVLAKMATTVDIVSGGRLIFGIGAGWHADEFEGFVGRFPSVKERLDGLEEAVQICKSMFENEYTNFAGRTYSAKNTLNSPRPTRGHIPIMIGGAGEKRTLRIAAKYADICHVVGHLPPSELEHKIGVLKKHCVDVGRDFSTITVGTGFRPLLNATSEEVRREIQVIAGSGKRPLDKAKQEVENVTGVDNVLKTIEGYRSLGVDLITLAGPILEELEDFKESILSRFTD